MIGGLVTTLFIERLHALVRFFATLGTDFNPNKKAGGFFAALVVKEAAQVGLAKIRLFLPSGDIPDEKIDTYANLAYTTKPGQLMNHPGDVLSWQSRDRDAGLWGGAIRCPDPKGGPDIILSFSGLTEAGDEVVCLCMAIMLDLLTVEQARELADISGSRPLLEHFLSNV